jgi:hypothetical protein
LYEDGCPIHESLKGFSEWMLSVGTISILERLAARHDKFYERLLAKLNIQVQEYISSCADSAKAEAIKSSLLNLEMIKQNLRLQNVSNLAWAVFPETTPPTTGGGKRPAKGGASEGTTSKPAPNQNPHQSLALTSYAEWDKVGKLFTYIIPKAGNVDVCRRYHCRQICNTRCKNVHGRLSSEALAATEAWVLESKSKTARGVLGRDE